MRFDSVPSFSLIKAEIKILISQQVIKNAAAGDKIGPNQEKTDFYYYNFIPFRISLFRKFYFEIVALPIVVLLLLSPLPFAHD